jgi:uncharacterized delta-60 repeat protein
MNNEFKTLKNQKGKTMKTLTLLAMLLLTVPSFIYGQAIEEWARRYDGTSNGDDYSSSVAVDQSGNIYVAGSVSNAGSDLDFVVMKYNMAGQIQWTRTYNGPAYSRDGIDAMVLDAAGNIYVTGFSRGSDQTLDYATLKYNPAGVLMWVQRYNTGAIDVANAIAVDNSGNVYVTGYAVGTSTTWDYTTIKYSSDGVQQWVRFYNGPGNGTDVGMKVKTDISGNVYVTGWSDGTTIGSDYATVKYNSSGTQQWVVRYNGPGNGTDVANALAVDAAGNSYVTGYSKGNGTGYDMTTIKYNSSGSQTWVARYNDFYDSTDQGNALTLDASGNVYVTGTSFGIFGFSFGQVFTTIKYSSSGSLVWASFLSGTPNRNGFGYDIVYRSGNVYVTGFSGYGTAADYVTSKYNSSGELIWQKKYNGPANSYDNAFGVAVDAYGNAYVTGRSTGTGTAYDVAVIKYTEATGIEPISSETPDKFSLSQNYPNPFNPATKIRFALPKDASVKLTVYDEAGREAAVLVNEQLRAGIYEYALDASHLSSGVYFYTLVTDGFTETKKMMLVK